MRSPHRQRWAAAALVGSVLATAGCTANDEDGSELAAGRVVEVPFFAVDVDSRVDVGLPSGVLTLGLAPELTSVTTDSGELTPVEDATMVGLTWSFVPHPSSDARTVLLDGQQPQSLPEPTVALMDGSEALPVPIEAQAGRSGETVVGASDPVGIEVSYDGVTQTVDLDTGALGAGQAEGLTDLDEASTPLRRLCAARDFPSPEVLDNDCAVTAVHRLPYLAGLGWAPESQTWLVVDASTTGEPEILLGDDPGTMLESAPPSVRRSAYAVSGDAPRSVNFDFGPPIGTVSVSLDD